MKKTYKYKAKINKQTESNALQWLYLCRTLYNTALEQRITVYRQSGISLSAVGQKNELPALKQVFPEFKTVGSQVLQDVIERLDRSFQAFFRRLKRGEKPGFPRFRGHDRYDSFTLKQAGWKLDDRNLHIRNLGRFKLYLSRSIEGDIKTVTVRRTAAGDWYVCFSCDNVPERKLPEIDAAIGIDVGIKSFAVDSDGTAIQNPKHLCASEKKLRRSQRSLSRKKKGSNRRKKAKRRVAKVHQKVTNQRRDFCHKTANYYVENYGDIHIENLTIKNMVKNKHLSKSIMDASWGLFFTLLTYKAEEAGRQLVKVKPNGTSQHCSTCGEKVPKTLSVRVHRCPHCGLVLDRDENAALNILRAGQVRQASTLPLGGVA